MFTFVHRPTDYERRSVADSRHEVDYQENLELYVTDSRKLLTHYDEPFRGCG